MCDARIHEHVVAQASRIEPKEERKDPKGEEKRNRRSKGKGRGTEEQKEKENPRRRREKKGEKVFFHGMW